MFMYTNTRYIRSISRTALKYDLHRVRDSRRCTHTRHNAAASNLNCCCRLRWRRNRRAINGGSMHSAAAAAAASDFSGIYTIRCMRCIHDGAIKRRLFAAYTKISNTTRKPSFKCKQTNTYTNSNGWQHSVRTCICNISRTRSRYVAAVLCWLLSFHLDGALVAAAAAVEAAAARGGG